MPRNHGMKSYYIFPRIRGKIQNDTLPDINNKQSLVIEMLLPQKNEPAS
jgi:hypothetical protein